jgi:hypothetical protein
MILFRIKLAMNYKREDKRKETYDEKEGIGHKHSRNSMETTANLCHLRCIWPIRIHQIHCNQALEGA